MTYQETLDYLFSQLPMFHRVGAAAYKPGLDNTYALLQITGHPEKALKTVHVAGTNGKGSTSHMIASVLQEAGYKTGLYTSPHLRDFRERIRINGEMMSQDAVVDFVSRYKEDWQSIQPSFFEITVAMAFDYFREMKTDINVIEVGLGGRLDSTNVISPEVCVITNIGMDHMNLLGDTIEQIASEKAGIIKSQIPVVAGIMRSEALQVMESKARQEGAPLIYARDVDPLTIPNPELKGTYQQQNKVAAYLALQELIKKGWQISEEHISKGFANVIRNTGLLGRWQVLHEKPLAIADVAHNEDGLKMVFGQVKATAHKQLRIVIGFVNDKDLDLALMKLPKDAIYYFCKAQIPRALEVDVLQARATHFGLIGTMHTSVESAYHKALEEADEADLVLVTGSIFVVAEVV